MKELLVISGKGGTGKTSIVAAFATLVENAVFADCDVDAADLHLILHPKIKHKEKFVSGHEAVIRKDACVGCGACYAYCRFGAIKRPDEKSDQTAFEINPLSCEGCGVCVRACPVKAIDFPNAECGEWYVSDTRKGKMVHARLHPGGENSGKLVSAVRSEAKKIAEANESDFILIDGPPGVGCPVIASLGGVSMALIVTEPTLSGEHDLGRILDLANHFKVPAAICINKWDLNPEIATRIEQSAKRREVHVAGRINYSKDFTIAQRKGKAVTELYGSKLAEQLKSLWKQTKGLLDNTE